MITERQPALTASISGSHSRIEVDRVARTRRFAAAFAAFFMLFAGPGAKSEPIAAALDLPDGPVVSPLQASSSSPAATPAGQGGAQSSPAQNAPMTEEERRKLSDEQLKKQEKQRVFAVMATFNTTANKDAVPLSTGQKYQLFFKSATDPWPFVLTAFGAGIDQADNSFPEYGQGVQGYAKRYGAAYADEALSRMIGSAILPSLLHQDPRYFYRGSGSKKSRALYAISAAIICRGDNGRMEPNYSYVLGSFAAGGISNLYHPASDRGVGLTIGNGFLNVATHALDNLGREFVFRKLTPKVPDYAQGKP